MTINNRLIISEGGSLFSDNVKICIPSGNNFSPINIIDTTFDVTVPFSSYLNVETFNTRSFFHLKDKNEEILATLSTYKSVSSNNKNTLGFRINYQKPKNSSFLSETLNGTFDVIFLDDSIYPQIRWMSPTQGFSPELTRVDWVKNRIRDYSMPDYSKQVHIEAAWPESGWINNLGNGWLLVDLEIDNLEIENQITIYDITVNQTCCSYGSVEKSGIDCMFPVISGHHYICCYYKKNPAYNLGMPCGLSGALASNRLKKPPTPIFTPIKY